MSPYFSTSLRDRKAAIVCRKPNLSIDEIVSNLAKGLGDMGSQDRSTLTCSIHLTTRSACRTLNTMHNICICLCHIIADDFYTDEVA